jgi:hypothetical protein
VRSAVRVTSRRWRRALASVKPAREGGRFLIFAQGRTGSTLLVELLDSHPRVTCDGEIFSPNTYGRIRDLDRHLRGSVNMAVATGDTYGFKVKPYQLTHHGADPRAFLQRRTDEGWAIIHLVRSNYVRHALSTSMREQRGLIKVHVGSAAEALEQTRRFHIDPVRLVHSARGRREFFLEECRALDDIPHLTVEYERDLFPPDAHQATADRVFASLGLPSSPVSTRLARLNPGDLSAKIANFDEVVAAVDRSEFAGMLTAVGS